MPLLTPSSDWRQLRLWQIQPIRDALIILAVVGLVYLGYILSVVTVPILIALLLAYLFEPLVRWVSGRGWVSRPFAALAIIVITGLVVVVPAAVGGVFAVMQGGKLLRDTAVGVRDVLASAAKPTDERLLQRVPEESGWRALRDFLVDQQARAAQRRAAESVNSATTPSPFPPPSAEPAAPAGSNSTPADPTTPSATPATAPSGSPSAADGTGPAADAASPATSSLAPTPAPTSVTPAPEPTSTNEPRSVRSASESTDEEPSPDELIAAGLLPPDVLEPDSTTAAAGPRPARTGFEVPLFDLDATDVVKWLRSNAETITSRLLTTSVDAVAIGVGFGQWLFAVVFGGFLTAFFFYYFCTGWGRVLGFWGSLIPERRKGRTFELLAQMDTVIAGFVRGRLTIAFLLGIFLTGAYWFIGVPAPLILGPIVGALFIVPYINVIGVPVAILLLWFQPAVHWDFQENWWWIISAPPGVYAIAQFLDDWVLSPTIQGKSTNMDAPSILFASMAGGVLAGVYGLLLAIPAAACLKILLREIVWPRFRAWGRGEARDPLPIQPTEG